MIYFIEDWRLAQELRDGKTPESEKFIYFMLIAIWGLISGSASFIAWSFTPLTHIERMLDLYIFVISIVGLWTCYDRNKEGDNRDIVTRLTCLGFPAFVRMSIVGVVIVLVGMGFDRVTGLGISDDMLMGIANLIMFPYFYYRLYKTIGIAAFPAPIK